MASRFLRSKTEIAINELAVACMEAADIHEIAADDCDDPAVETKLTTLAQARRRTSDSLADYLVRHYDGPNWPDDERELLKKAASHVKSALSPNGAVSLFSDCLAKEEHIREASAAALREDVSPSLRGPITNLRDDAESQIRWLNGLIQQE